MKLFTGGRLKKHKSAKDWPTTAQDLFASYEESFPSQQNAVDLIPGWSTAFPTEFALKAGNLPLFADARIHWAIEQFGDLKGSRVLELGPLEAAHTTMLNAAGAHVEAIEANKLAYLKCLISKEVYQLSNTRFYLGDFVQWLEKTDTTYDLIIASGVLYHMRDPLRLLQAMVKRTRTIYLWTVCIENDELQPTKIETINGVPARLYARHYGPGKENQSFCGGMVDRPYWMHRNDILAVLKSFGFSNITIAHEEPEHLHGPCFSIFAKAD